MPAILFADVGQGTLDGGGTFDLATLDPPPVAPGARGSTSFTFEYAGPTTTSPQPLYPRGAGNVAQAGPVSLIQYVANPAGDSLFSDGFYRDAGAVVASSPDIINGANVPSNAIDRDLSTFWQPVAGTGTATLMIDRGIDAGPMTFTRVWFHQPLGPSTFYAYDYTIQTSPDAVMWTTRATVVGNTSINRIDQFASTAHRYVRIVMTAYQAAGGDLYAHLAIMEFAPGAPLGTTDSVFGGTDAAWIIQSGVWGVLYDSYALELTGGGGQFTAVVPTGLADVTLECTFPEFSDGGVSWRATDDNNYWLLNFANIFKRVGGGFVAVGVDFAAALGRHIQGGDRVRVVVTGNVHEVYVQLGAVGSFILASTVTDAFNNTATDHGLRSDTTPPWADTFSAFTINPAVGAVGVDPVTVTGNTIEARHTRVGAMGSHTVLDQSFKREWVDPRIDVGSGKARMLATDPDLSSFVWDGNDLVQFVFNGELAYTIVVDTPTTIDVDIGEERAQGWQLEGRGHLSLPERGVVYPTGGPYRSPPQEDRVLDYTDPSFDDSTWPFAHIITYIFWVVEAPWGAGGTWGTGIAKWDAAFSDKTAALLWSPAGSTTTAPVGKVYGRQWFYMANADDHAFFQGEADNTCDFFLNGALILSNTNWTQVSSADVSVPAGWNLLATAAENRGPLPAYPFNPAAWAWALYDYGYPPITYAKSDGTCKILAYPASVPSMSVGMAIRILVEEAQARGALLWLVLGFTDSHDSAGVPWPTPQISTKVGTNLLTLLVNEIAETYADFWMAPSSTTLYAWNKGGRGRASGLVARTPTDPNDPTTGNLTALSHGLVL